MADGICLRCGRLNRPTAHYCASCGLGLQGLLSKDALLKQRYRIIDLIGRGGTGPVYRADDSRLPGRKLAIKERLNVTAETRGANPDRGTTSAMFIQEAQLLARLFHPHVRGTD